MHRVFFTKAFPHLDGKRFWYKAKGGLALYLPHSLRLSLQWTVSQKRYAVKNGSRRRIFSWIPLNIHTYTPKYRRKRLVIKKKLPGKPHASRRTTKSRSTREDLVQPPSAFTRYQNCRSAQPYLDKMHLKDKWYLLLALMNSLLYPGIGIYAGPQGFPCQKSNRLGQPRSVAKQTMESRKSRELLGCSDELLWGATVQWNVEWTAQTLLPPSLTFTDIHIIILSKP